MDKTHLDECKPAIHEAARRGLEHFRRPDPDQASDGRPEQAEQQDPAPDELAGRLRSERCDTVADAVEAGIPWAILACRRRLMAARGILSAVVIENNITLAIPEDTAHAIEAAMESIDAATVPANIGN